jgi:hypothetical protein
MPEPFATVYARRVTLEAKHRKTVWTAWTALTDQVDVAAVVASLDSWLSAPVGVVEAAADPTPGIAASIAAQQQLQRETDARTALRLVVEDALTEAEAQGTADAEQLVAEVRGALTAEFDLAFQDAMDALAEGEGFDAAASDWLDEVVGGYARDVGRAIADGIEQGLGRDALEGLVADVLGDSRGVGVLLDYAIANALSDGALRVYADENVARVDFFTAGDDRVDDECVTAEVGSPYALADAPKPALHVGCRCMLAPSDEGMGTSGWDAVQSLIEQTSEGGD